VWWASRASVDVYLGSRLTAVALAGSPIAHQPVDGLSAALNAAIHLMGSETQPRRLNLWLSGGLCRPFLLPERSALKSPTEVRELAMGVAPQRTGLASECEVWLDDKNPLSPVVAVERAVLEEIKRTFATHWRRAAVRPWWSNVHRMAIAEVAGIVAFGLQDCDSVTVLTGRGEEFTWAGVSSPVFDKTTGNAAWARAMVHQTAEHGATKLYRIRVGQTEGEPALACAFGRLLEAAR
jgi:hypothetical protein